MKATSGGGKINNWKTSKAVFSLDSINQIRRAHICWFMIRGVSPRQEIKRYHSLASLKRLQIANTPPRWRCSSKNLIRLSLKLSRLKLLILMHYLAGCTTQRLWINLISNSALASPQLQMGQGLNPYWRKAQASYLATDSRWFMNVLKSKQTWQVSLPLIWSYPENNFNIAPMKGLSLFTDSPRET